ncbi:6PF2K-domain-containing protein [Acrodontium crateriforme]|uniref:6PF2K-domain-containing protein n=1 Tax=Acrodontium crateriforme TaxID=150365 RepID=A0AAQ3RC37_9PEZI|nr:6PF2K-domain-containing protein [Acrodontium crateriforme]
MPHSISPPSPSSNFLLVDHNAHSNGTCSCVTSDDSPLGHFRRRLSSQSTSATRRAAMSSVNNPSFQRRNIDEDAVESQDVDYLRNHLVRALSPQLNRIQPDIREQQPQQQLENSAESAPVIIKGGSLRHAMRGTLPEATGASIAQNDTPSTTAPNSPHIPAGSSTQSTPGSDPFSLGPPGQHRAGTSGTSTPRSRPTTLDIPGLTKSKVSPDGRIAQRDVGAKLVIVMVGLPARGKSYITKKLARYLNWLQHDTRIFNVGERRRVAAGGPNSLEKTKSQIARASGHRPSLVTTPTGGVALASESSKSIPSQPASVAKILLNGEKKLEPPATPPNGAQIQDPAYSIHDHSNRDRAASIALQKPDMGEPTSPVMKNNVPSADNQTDEQEEPMDHNASFFDPCNKKAFQIREQVARETLDELLDYILYQGGSVGILDATNSTMARRKMVIDRIRERAGPDLNVLFLESRCVDQDLLEANMRLKLNGPDYRDMDPTIALEDFKKRVAVYEKAYVPLGEYEEQNNMPYIQMIDVGRKIISHQIRGFLSAQANYYLLNFNLAPRQIWITRHGLSMDNISGKIGGDSDLSPEGHQYAKSLARFVDEKRREWDQKKIADLAKTHFPPQPGDVTPPNPYYQPQSPGQERRLSSFHGLTGEIDGANVPGFEPSNFCVWTSMLKRSIQTAQYFNDEVYDTKQMRMLDELNAGVMEGLTYSCISSQFPDEYQSRKSDKLHYRYPGPGGEGYLDIINRLRPVIVELERMTDHVLLVGHRSVSRVLLAYFRGLKREEVADLDVPLGMLYCLEPKPYGVDFKAYKWDKSSQWFYECPNFELKPAEDDMQ